MKQVLAVRVGAKKAVGHIGGVRDTSSWQAVATLLRRWVRIWHFAIAFAT